MNRYNIKEFNVKTKYLAHKIKLQQEQDAKKHRTELEPNKRTPCIYGCGTMLQSQSICRSCHRKGIRSAAKNKKRIAPIDGYHQRKRS